MTYTEWMTFEEWVQENLEMVREDYQTETGVVLEDQSADKVYEYFYNNIGYYQDQYEEEVRQAQEQEKALANGILC